LVGIADFLQIRRYCGCTSDHVEQEVPLRAKEQQDNRADSETPAGANQHEQNDREQRCRGYRCSNLRTPAILFLTRVQFTSARFNSSSLLSSLAELAFCGQALVVGKVFGGFRN